MTAQFVDALTEDGYALPVQMASGEWLAVRKMMYTTGLFVIADGDTVGYRCRWCYENTPMALRALFTWDGVGDDPPGPWVKQKGRDSRGRPVDRLNPQLANPEVEF